MSQTEGKKLVAIITGATGGIGSATAQALAAPNSILMLHGHRRSDALTRLANRLRETSAEVETVQADLASVAEQDRLADFLETWLDSIDPDTIETLCWIHAAGVDLMAEEIRVRSYEERMRAVFAVDVVAAIRLSRRIGEWMRCAAKTVESNGLNKIAHPSSILFFGWDGVSRGMEGETAQLYAAAKGAITGFAKSLAQELAGAVRVLTISPGWIATTWGEKASEKANDRGCRASLAGRWGTPEEVADLAAFLISPRAAFINAQNIEINGGFNYRPDSRPDTE